MGIGKCLEFSNLSISLEDSIAEISDGGLSFIDGSLELSECSSGGGEVGICLIHGSLGMEGGTGGSSIGRSSGEECLEVLSITLIGGALVQFFLEGSPVLLRVIGVEPCLLKSSLGVHIGLHVSGEFECVSLEGRVG